VKRTPVESVPLNSKVALPLLVVLPSAMVVAPQATAGRCKRWEGTGASASKYHHPM